ncbi:MAG: alpha/beta hydrolase [Firmicutes bacterium]|nr:alpha/beta hydrolase [Bacillota bacterium]
MERRIPLEKTAEEVCEASSKPPFIFQLPPEEGRLVLDKAQDTPVFMYPATISSYPLNLGSLGEIKLYFVSPDYADISQKQNVIFYMHGAGWVFGNFHTHEKLVRELAARTNSVVVFPEYSLSPEVKYPVAVEQCYFILNNLPNLMQNWNVRFDTLTVAGDSVGGNMATVMAIMSKEHGGIKIHKELLYYPVTNAYFDTESYLQFATGYYLQREGMMWFWNQYTTSEKNRNEITASPLRATTEQLRGMPDTMILVGEADVLRDEGESYARKLLEADVNVTAIRFNAIIHDFVMLNALDQTNATRAAMDVSTAWINRKNAERGEQI